jgi:hypothetical protein
LFIPDPDLYFLPIPDPRSRGLKGPDPDPQHCLLQGKPLDVLDSTAVDADASVWEEADITPTTTLEEEEEEFKDETEVELTQTLEEVSYMFARYQCCGSASFWQAGSGDPDPQQNVTDLQHWNKHLLPCLVSAGVP